MRDVLAHVRAYAIPQLPARDPEPTAPTRPARRPRWTPERFGKRVLVFDTETTLDPAQRLLVGAYRLYEWSDHKGRYRLLEEGLVRGDGLGPAQTALLRRYARKHGLPNLSREEFAIMLTEEYHDLGTLLVGFNHRFDLGAIALPRIRCRQRKKRAKVRYRPGWGQGRGRWRRGWRLRLLNAMSRPALLIRSAGDSTFIEWAPYAVLGEDGKVRTVQSFKGRDIDLRDAVRALTGETLSLEGACALFGVPFRKQEVAYGRISRALLDYLRDDMMATWRLFLAVREESNRHPFTPVPSPRLPVGARAADTPDLSPEARLLSRMRSQASIAKGYHDLMGLQPRLEVQPDFPRDALGQAMEAFYGGRIEAHPDLQGVVLPVVSLDVMSTYLSVNVLMGLHRWDTAARLVVEDATEDARRLLDTLTLDDLFHPDLWPGLAVFCEVEVHGDMLPIRYPEMPGDAPTCHMKRVHPGTPGLTLWYALPDLIYSKLVTGHAPKIRRAWRLVPEGTLSGLQTVLFRGEVALDPHTDFYRAFRDARIRDVQPRLAEALAAGHIEEARSLDRLQRAMKAVGEPLGFGVYVEVDEKDLLPREAFERGTARADVWAGNGHFEARITREEYPGRWFFSPRGAIVTSGARLLLGMKERLLTQASGSIIAMHTDSVMEVATEKGGAISLPVRSDTSPESPRTVHALSWAEVERFRARFASLSGIPGMSLWKREKENEPHPDATRDRNLYILSYGPGRYALFNRADDGRILLRDRKETALGHLIPPPGYTRDQVVDAVWEALIREALGEHGAVARLPFASSEAFGRLPITTPDLLRRIRTRPRGSRKTAAPDPRPFGFMTTAYTMSDDAILGRHAYWSGWCRLKKVETVGCPAPREACPHRKTCPLAYPIQPVTYDVPGPDLLRKGQWFDAHTGRPLPPLHTITMDTSWAVGLRVRTWAEYIRHTLAQGTRSWEDQDPEVRVLGLVYTGKEGRHLEDIAASLRVPGDEVLVYTLEVSDVEQQDEVLRAAIRTIPMRFLMEQTRMHHSSLQRFRNGRTRHLHLTHRRLLWQAVSAWVREHPDAGMIVPAPGETSSPPADAGNPGRTGQDLKAVRRV